ncbi:mitochondrial fission ELM1 family protein [Candidatus Tisiphia endosymbiont of Nemotelus uliginosus]|uniref:mitochondrial fission ELM1 family protein n=1 Tax=Candidatus Tisiphia endosymbiont of Nemotelus uliginosus TaxID=3077926 RepID=UPI0035C89E50
MSYNEPLKDLVVWILADSRVGNLNQAIALAQQLGLNYELKPVEYNFWVKLPNFLLALLPIHVTSNFPGVKEVSKLPDVIISSGRRTASLASYLRRKSGNKIKIIQIMHPNLPFKQFELVILPDHDKVSRYELNTIRITGALNNVQAKLAIAGRELRQNYPQLGEFISVIIGGNSKNYNFTIENAIEFAEILSHIATNQHRRLFISFSRRTPLAAKQIITKNLLPGAIIYDPTITSSVPNPYMGMLAEADYIIATADSISMCSEAASTGKPLYILCPKNFRSPKHLSFLEQLLKLGIARILNKSTANLAPYQYVPLNEVERISNIVISKIR